VLAPEFSGLDIAHTALRQQPARHLIVVAETVKGAIAASPHGNADRGAYRSDVSGSPSCSGEWPRAVG